MPGHCLPSNRSTTMAKKTTGPIINGTSNRAGQQLASTKLPIDLTSIRAVIANEPITDVSNNATYDSSSASTMIKTAMIKAITAEQSRQLKPFLLVRGAHRLLAFWLRHPTRFIPSTNVDEGTLLAAAKTFIARYGCDKAGNPLQRVEASYKTGPSYSKRKKYEIFEDILLWEDEEEEEKLRRIGHKAALAIAAEDDKLWALLKEPMGEYWERVAAETQNQGTVMELDFNLEITEQVQHAANELQVKVEVLVRKRLRQVKIYEQPVLETGELDKKKLRWKKFADPHRRRQ